MSKLEGPSLEDGSRFTMQITLELDFEYENSYGEEVDPSYVEDQFMRALNEQIHDMLIGNEEFMFWVMQNFRDLTGFDDVEELHELGPMHLKITKMNDKEIVPSCENCEIYQKWEEQGDTDD